MSAGSRSWQRNGEESPKQAGQGNISFDAERLWWRRHGDWVLPLTSEAYFDAELDAWVGLCGERNGTECFCACDVARDAAELTSAPAWKLGQDRLFRKGPQLHLGAKLLYMGDSKFCLVESVLHKDDDDRLVRDSMHEFDLDARRPWPRRRVLRVTTFRLKYNNKGGLWTNQARS